eukprot:symbB.v1.2.031741.t1/scaffold3487.1/size55659/4
MASNEGMGPFKFFSGESEDTQEFKRFRTWCKNKMLTMDKLTKEARGPFVYTLLTGKALECVEHVPPEDYQKADGDEVLWKPLETRFPQKDSTDELGEMMTQVFSMKSQDGETLKSWVARTSDLFERCARKTGVSFPDEARGWLILHKAGLSDEQKAVALARAQGSLKREQICKALRSCFPEMVLKKKIHGANLIEDQEAPHSADEIVEDEAQDFEDVELLLSEHQPNTVEDPFLESDVAEVLAASWREKRQELKKLQKARKFGQVRETKKAFRVEIEELKKRTKCHSHDDMKSLEKKCPGSADPKHSCHDVVAGSHPAVGSVSAFAGGYPQDFVMAVLNTVPRFTQQEVLYIVDDQVPEDCWDEIHEVAALEASTEEGSKSIRDAISKLHRNLGHPPNHDLVRILKHAQASDEAIKAAREFSCPACQSRSKPHVPLPAQTDRVVDFNKVIGIDVKHLPGWKPNQKIKSLNVVDQASGFQRVIPFFEAETSNLLRSLLESHWISWAGPPSDIILDPAQTNLGEPLVIPLESQGINIRVIAAEAHWQLGKTENHGGWFARVLQRVIDDHSPSSKEEWLECVHHAHIKNAMIQHHGFSPQQYVFGRNVDIPSDLLNEPLRIVPATASLTNAAIAKSQEMRNSARKAILELQDSRALRSALAARPRASITYQPGDLVAYWRSQKWIKGELHQNGAWYGTAVVLGTVGRNLILIHRKTVLRCAPEQVRPATSEEKVVANTPESELLGIKDMIEGGALKSRQYVDLTPHAYPTEGSHVDVEMPLANPETPAEASSSNQQSDELPAEPAVNPSAASPDASEPARLSASLPEDSTTEPVIGETPDERPDKSPMPSSYGPVRRRIHNKNGPMSLFRPAPMQQEEFVEIMREVVPHMIDELNQGIKRTREDDTSSPVIDLESSESSEPAASRARTTEVLSVADLGSHIDWNTQHLDMEVLIAEYLKKKMLKELPHSKNPPKLQRMVDEGKRLEWQTIVNKPHSVKLHFGKAATNIRENCADRFIGSRYVLTRKPLEEGAPVDPEDLDSFTVKGRWCLQGHLDPDLELKALDGRLKSPTLSQLGRMTLMQTLASFNWMLQLGDIKGAFLEAGPLEDKYRPLYAHQPPGGIPGVSPEAVIEICGNLYGQNDAPAAWFKAFDEELRAGGWIASCFDGCLYTLRNSQNELIGILGVHVDDCALGGTGDLFEKEVKRLRDRFPFAYQIW